MNAGIPCFLANAAITAWIKFALNQPPAIVVTVLQGLAVLYLLGSHARWVQHLFAEPSDSMPQAPSIPPSPKKKLLAPLEVLIPGTSTGNVYILALPTNILLGLMQAK